MGGLLISVQAAYKLIIKKRKYMSAINASAYRPASMRTNMKKLNEYYEGVETKLSQGVPSIRSIEPTTILHKWYVAYRNYSGSPVFVQSFVLGSAWGGRESIRDIRSIFGEAPAKLTAFNDDAYLWEISHQAFIHDKNGVLIKTLPKTNIRY